MKKRTFLLAFIFPFLLRAEISLAKRSCSDSEKGVLKCLNEALPLLKNMGDPSAEKCSQNPKSHKCAPSSESIEKKCKKFISEKNSDFIGPWGEMVQAYLREKEGKLQATV